MSVIETVERASSSPIFIQLTEEGNACFLIKDIQIFSRIKIEL